MVALAGGWRYGVDGRIMNVTSWVIVSKETGEAVMETFCQNTIKRINLEKHDVMPVMAYLQHFNQKIKEQES